MKIALLGLICAVLLAAGCNEAPQEAASSAGQPAAAAGGAAAPAPVMAGTQLELDGGMQVTVLSVGSFDEQQQSLDGWIAVEGRVAEAYPERGALILVDTGNMEGCADACCPQVQVPVKLALEDYAGTMPAFDQQVVIIGEFSRQELGYELQVSEIHSGGTVLLKRKA